MESKKDKALRLLKKCEIFRCPVCDDMLTVKDNYTVQCSKGHSFDISKKGILNLSGKSNDKIYNRNLFENRRKVIENGCYKPLIEYISNIINEYSELHGDNINILDAGCGEGSFLNALNNKSDSNLSIGIDLSSEGINLATNSTWETVWLIDDLSDIHIQDHRVDIILNILSPANYMEFKRVLKPDGIIVKVVPGEKYLHEIREILKSKTDTNSDDHNLYDNTETMLHTKSGMDIIKNQHIDYTLKLSEEEYEWFINMTPLTHNKNLNQLRCTETCSNFYPNKKAYGLTIDLEVLVGKPY